MLKVPDIRRVATRVAEKYALKSVTLFGSYARGEEDESSDVDLVIESTQPLGFARGAIYNELEQSLDCPVDVIFGAHNLYPFIRNAYEREGVVLYEA